MKTAGIQFAKLPRSGSTPTVPESLNASPALRFLDQLTYRWACLDKTQLLLFHMDLSGKQIIFSLCPSQHVCIGVFIFSIQRGPRPKL